MTYKKINIFITVFSILLFGCSSSKETEGEAIASPIAKAYDNSLYLQELENLVPSGSDSGDSLTIIDQYVTNWLKKHTVLHAAKKDSNIDLEIIHKKAEEYKHQLLLYEFQKHYINDQLDTVVDKYDINNFYQSHIEDFMLQHVVVKCAFAKIANSNPNISQLSGAFYSSYNDEKIREFALIASNTAEYYIYSDTNWIYLNKVVSNSPFSDKDEIVLVKNHKYTERIQDGYRYYLRLVDYKLPGDVVPMELVKNDIIKSIIGQRKQNLLTDLENKLFESAVNAKEIERFE